MQSEAEPGLCRVAGEGISAATAGVETTLTIVVSSTPLLVALLVFFLSHLSRPGDAPPDLIPGAWI